MLYFLNPSYLYLLILVPVILTGYGVLCHFQKKRIRDFAPDKRMAELMMPSASRAKGWIRTILFSLAFASFTIGIARPRTGAKLAEFKSSGAEVMICLDVSNSMLAQDYSPSRLDRAKLAISLFVDKLKDERIGLIIFAGESFVQLPITCDYLSAKSWISNIGTDSVPVQGTAIGDAIRTAVRSFSGQSDKSRAIILITDGENHEDDAIEAARDAFEAGGTRVFTVGVGSPEGKPIPIGGELLKDNNGEIVVSKLDEEGLQSIAAAGGGMYARATNSDFKLNPIIDEIHRMQDEEFSSFVFTEYDEKYMHFFGAALLLLVVEMLIGRRRIKLDFFKKQ